MPSRDFQDKIPGLRGSAAFFTSLQQNLSIDDSLEDGYSSPFLYPLDFSTPRRMGPKRLTPLVLPSLLSLDTYSSSASDTSSASPTSSVSSGSKCFHDRDALPAHPEDVRIFIAHSKSDKAAALRLLADSVAEQRNLALRALLAHPLHILALVLVVFLVHTWSGSKPAGLGGNRAVWLSLAVLAGFTAAAVCIASLPYRKLSHGIGSDWLGQEEVLVAWRDTSDATMAADEKAGPTSGEIIGVAVLAWRPTEGKIGRKGRRVGRAWINGWAVDKNFRGQAIGRSLLNEAARTINARGGDGIFFAEHHAHSTLALPNFYCGPFVRRDLRAQNTLAAAWESNRTSGHKRRNSGR